MRDCALVEMKYPISEKPWVIIDYRRDNTLVELSRFKTEDEGKAYMFDLLLGER